jgi:hypothetical protein
MDSQSPLFPENQLAMSPRPPGTRQVNLKLTVSQEEIVRLVVQRLREGGLEFEARMRQFVSGPPIPRYMHIDELDRRFGEIERRMLRLEKSVTGETERPDAEAKNGEPRKPPRTVTG